MSVTYTLESFTSFFAEAKDLLKDHWLEVARDHEAVPYDPNVPEYLMLESLGQLQVLVMRDAGVMAGYHLSIVKPHLHYRTTLHAFTDIYYVDPQFRRGFAGYNLFKEAVREWARRGVRKAYTGTKVFGVSVKNKKLDITRLLQRQGWQKNEHSFTLLIGENHGT